ncbi:hypothetical protein O6H91_21G030200 [Diphasiastrum complanatum]|uniref:Uncharacterized protein n=1 Tax=Diphasiastrum complanatum TaxID=34168 RepID=A0ACC2AKW5_DIPCM|nr:hypothetical protein O6H91_21G030200 [Diphasiastrum complanatum]
MAIRWSVFVCMILLSWLLLIFITSATAATTSPYVRRPARGPVSLGRLFGPTAVEDVQQVHASLAGPNHMRVSWISVNTGIPSIVEYGTASGSYDSVATGDSTSYTFVFYTSGQIHNVVIGPLKDNTVYYYRCGGVSLEFRLRTPPPLGPHVPVKFTVVGDLGQTGWTTSTLDHIQQSEYDVLLFAGDLSYADYYEPLWDSFGRMVEPLASRRPWMVTEGNHEIEEIPFFIAPFRSYNARWLMPYAESGSTSNLFYSFEVGSAHVLMLGSYTSYVLGSPQYEWLQDDLAKVDRSKTPWLIAVLHAPWYSSNWAHRGDGAAMMAAMEPLLKEARVDIVIAGHVHAYERTTRVFLGMIDPCGIHHITIGDGGNREGLARSFRSPQPAWSVFREASFGHGNLNILNATHAFWCWHRNEDEEPVLADHIYFTTLSAPSNECSCASETLGKTSSTIEIGDAATLSEM